MGKRGPMPEKDFRKVLSGNLPVTKENLGNNDFEIIAPQRPKHLSKEEKKVWKDTIKLLGSLNILEEVDGPILSAFCCSYCRWITVEKEIQKLAKEEGSTGLILETDNGRSINPLVIISRRAQKDTVTYAAQLGMTPAARLRLDLDDSSITKRKVNAFEKLKKIKDERMDKKSEKIRKRRK
ncbi:MAG: phage terminase small subunit P27 family [Candidatus Omnitrophica bacterium]|nr:phage terminase small subunit P27 family [Candidatus Omnitrophota bacterium]